MQMCENSHVRGYICVLTCAGPYVSCVWAKWQLREPFLWQHPLCYLTVSHWSQKLVDPAGLLGQQFPALYSCLPSNEVKVWACKPPYLVLFCGWWGLNLGPDAYMASAWPTWPCHWSWIAIPSLISWVTVSFSLWKHEVTALVILVTIDLRVYVQQIVAGKEYSALDSCLVAKAQQDREIPWSHIWALCMRKQKQAITPKWRLLTSSRQLSVYLPRLSQVGLPAFAGSVSYLLSTLLYVWRTQSQFIQLAVGQAGCAGHLSLCL